jgi:hypothetical protein
MAFVYKQPITLKLLKINKIIKKKIETFGKYQKYIAL